MQPALQPYGGQHTIACASFTLQRSMNGTGKNAFPSAIFTRSACVPFIPDRR
jgi:hypothetical protein